MEGWNSDILINLLDTLIDYRGKTPKKTSSGVPLVTAKIIKGGRILPFEEFIAENDYDSWMVRGLPQPGDVVLTTEAPLGEVAQLDNTKVALAQRIVTLRGKKGILDNTYLKYFLQSDIGRKRLTARETGTTVTGIKQSELRRVEISYPDFETQCRIASILKSMDDKIAINNRINHNLEEQAQALYKSWFVDFEPFKGGKFVDSELGMIPKGWRVLPFLSVARLCSGGTPKTDQKEFWNGSIPFFTPKDVGDSAFCLSTEKTITEEGLKNCNSSLYKAFTTFITARGTVGKLCMAGVPMAMNQTNYAICPASNIDVITLFLITKQLINSLRNKANGAVFDAITTRDFDGEKVTIAPQGVMDTFSSVVHPIYESILQNEMKNASLSQLRDSLLPKLMSGDFITSDIPC